MATHKNQTEHELLWKSSANDLHVPTPAEAVLHPLAQPRGQGHEAHTDTSLFSHLAMETRSSGSTAAPPPSLEQELQADEKNGINNHEMQRIVDRARHGKVTAAERQLIDREVGIVKNNATHHEGGGLTTAAEKIYEHFRTTGFTDKSAAFNQRLPSVKGQDAGNRLGKDPNPEHKPELANAGQRFQVDANTEMVDEKGRNRGEVTHPVLINYGQKKEIKGVEYVYAQDTMIDLNDKGKQGHASGWVPESAVNDPQGTLHNMPDVTAARAHDLKDKHHHSIALDVTGGNPAKWAGDSVVKNRRPGEGNQAATDYLRRDPASAKKPVTADEYKAEDKDKGQDVQVVNMLYNLPGKGGVAEDTIRTDNHAKFVLSNVPAREIPVFKNGHLDKHAPNHGQMEFVYGHLQGEDRFGWIAADALGGKIPKGLLAHHDHKAAPKHDKDHDHE